MILADGDGMVLKDRFMVTDGFRLTDRMLLADGMALKLGQCTHRWHADAH